MPESRPRLDFYTIEQTAADWGWTVDEVRHIIYHQKSLRIAVVTSQHFRLYQPPAEIHLTKQNLETNDRSEITAIDHLPNFLYLDLTGKGGSNFDRVTCQSGEKISIPRDERTTVFQDSSGTRFSLLAYNRIFSAATLETEKPKPIMILTGEHIDNIMFPGEVAPEHVVPFEEKDLYEKRDPNRNPKNRPLEFQNRKSIDRLGEAMKERLIVEHKNSGEVLSSAQLYSYLLKDDNARFGVSTDIAKKLLQYDDKEVDKEAFRQRYERLLKTKKTKPHPKE